MGEREGHSQRAVSRANQGCSILLTTAEHASSCLFCLCFGFYFSLSKLGGEGRGEEGGSESTQGVSPKKMSSRYKIEGEKIKGLEKRYNKSICVCFASCFFFFVENSLLPFLLVSLLVLIESPSFPFFFLRCIFSLLASNPTSTGLKHHGHSHLDHTPSALHHASPSRVRLVG